MLVSLQYFLWEKFGRMHTFFDIYMKRRLATVENVLTVTLTQEFMQRRFSLFTRT